MSNLLALPFKRTYQIDIKEPASNYIATQSGTHPDEFKGDIKEWQDLRNEGTGGVVHENRTQSTLLYHAQLVSILAKLPSDIQLSIPYSLAFNATSIPVSLNSLAFERSCVLFNLAALYSQLATAEDRSTPEGIKRATSHFQLAAGTLSYLKTSALPKLVLPHDEEIPADLTDGFLTGMEQLMLSQAQECCWQMAKLNQYKNSLIAKIALRVGSLYGAAYDAFAEASPSAKRLLPSDWLPHIQVKSLHFQAVAQFRKSMDEIETGNNYGVELARLGLAQDYSKRAYEIARRGRVSTPVLQDTQSLMETVEKGLVRAQRDNDLIYHKDVPASSSLPEIQETNLAKATVPPGLLRPEEALKSKRPLFQNLIGWGAREAIKIYNHRKGDLIQTRIVDVSQELQDRADEQLRKLNLPASLEALERHVGLPPSLLHKAEEVRLENGPDTIEASLEDVEMLAGRDAVILDEALDILDNEASEDEASRKEHPINRPPSHEANIELTDKAARYRQILDQAKESDESVRQKWYEWEEHIRQLTEDEETLDRLVPSSTNPGSASRTPESRHTRKLAQNLRNRLENLDVLHRDRAELVRRAKAMADSDDVEGRIMKAAAGFEKLAELHPAMFEDIMDEELAKYDRYLVEMDEQRKRVEEALMEIKSDNEAFISSRKEDPAVKERELALQQLDAAYFKYKEIGRNLDEGHKFYNDLAGILIQFREVCKEWSHQRNQELHSLTRTFQAMSMEDSAPQTRSSKQAPLELPPQPPSPRFPNNPPARKPPPGKSSLGKLPALTSDEWEFEEMELPPAPKDRIVELEISVTLNSGLCTVLYTIPRGVIYQLSQDCAHGCSPSCTAFRCSGTDDDLRDLLYLNPGQQLQNPTTRSSLLFAYYSGDSDSGGSSYSFGGKKKEKKDKKDKKEKKDKKDHKDKDGKDKDKKDKKDKNKDEKEHKDKDKKDKDKKDKKDKDKHHDDKPSTSYAAPSYPTVAGSSGHGGGHGVPSFPSFPSAAGGYHNPALGISHPSPLPPPSGPPPTAIPKTMSFDAPPSGYRVPLDSNDPSKSFPSHSFETSGPPVSYDLDGSPIFIGSVLLENSVHPCKIGPHLNPPAQVAYGGGEKGHHGRYDLLPFVPDQMEWVPTGYGQIPHGRTPVEGGYEEGGEKLYHALAVINDVKVPGKTGEHLGGANVGFGGAEHSIQEGYEILCWKY